jgi:hypothetical protein
MISLLVVVHCSHNFTAFYFLVHHTSCSCCIAVSVGVADICQLSLSLSLSSLSLCVREQPGALAPSVGSYNDASYMQGATTRDDDSIRFEIVS